MDVLVERCDSSFLTSVYSKPTFTGLYLSWDSFAPRSRKLNLIRCLSYIALNICCDSKIEEELKLIKEIFINNGYSEEVIDDNIKFTVTRFENKDKTFGPVYFRLPWLVLLASSLPRRLTPLCTVIIMLLLYDQFSLLGRRLILHVRTSCLSLNKVY